MEEWERIFVMKKPRQPVSIRRTGFRPVLSRKFAFLVFGTTAMVYLPVITWLLGQTFGHGQLAHAFIVFLLTGILLATSRDLDFRPVWKFTETCQNLLILSYIILAAGIYADWGFFILFSLAISLSALLLFVFGSSRRRFVFSSTGAFAIFTILAAILPAMDWPLRTIAGRWSAFGLNLIGQEARLGLAAESSQPMLMLVSNGNPFHVAAECNGFGMVSSCLMMGLTIVLYRDLSLPGRLGRLLLALLLALFFNSLRIIIIVLIAPHIPAGRYMLMHEIVGLVTTYGGLGILYLLLNLNSNP
jgi:exosortase/archaeosortase family protein